MSNLLENLLWQKLLPEQDLLMVVDNRGYPYMGAGLNVHAQEIEQGLGKCYCSHKSQWE